MTRAHASPSPTTSKTVALVYIRVSKYDPGDDGRKVSPQTQVDRCRALAPLKDMSVEVFEDLDYSGKNMKRPGFASMLERAQRGDVTLIACYSVSRLSRSVADLYAILQQLQELGIGFVSATEAIETATPMGKAFLGILAVLAQLEREQISQRVADALAYKRSQGQLLGTLPAGFQRGSDGAIGIDPKAASTIRLIFDQYASGGFSFRSRAAWLNGRGIKPIATRGGNGRPPAPLWSGDVLKEILKRPAYAGLVRGPEGLLPGQPPELIDLDTWHRCQDLRVRNRFLPEGLRPRHRASPFPLTPLLRCDHCGGSMRGKQASRVKGVSRYYVCSQRALYGTCPAAIVRADILEEELCRWLGTCHPDDRLEQTARELVERGVDVLGPAEGVDDRNARPQPVNRSIEFHGNAIRLLSLGRCFEHEGALKWMTRNPGKGPKIIDRQFDAAVERALHLVEYPRTGEVQPDPSGRELGHLNGAPVG